MIAASSTRFHLEMADRVHAAYLRYSDDAHAFADEIATAAVEYIPGAQHAGLTIVRGYGQVETASATGPYPALLDSVQKRYGQGPCIDAARDRPLIRVDDLEHDNRWPLYQRDALARTPVRSLLSLPLQTGRRPRESLNLFAEQTRAFHADAVEVASIYAIQAALAWSAVRANRELQRNLSARDTVAQAKGVIMERFDLDSEHATQLLNGLSEQSKIPVAEVSRRLVAQQDSAASSDGTRETPANESWATTRNALTRRGRGERHRQAIRESTRC